MAHLRTIIVTGFVAISLGVASLTFSIATLAKTSAELEQELTMYLNVIDSTWSFTNFEETDRNALRGIQRSLMAFDKNGNLSMALTNRLRTVLWKMYHASTGNKDNLRYRSHIVKYFPLPEVMEQIGEEGLKADVIVLANVSDPRGQLANIRLGVLEQKLKEGSTAWNLIDLLTGTSRSLKHANKVDEALRLNIDFFVNSIQDAKKELSQIAGAYFPKISPNLLSATPRVQALSNIIELTKEVDVDQAWNQIRTQCEISESMLKLELGEDDLNRTCEALTGLSLSRSNIMNLTNAEINGILGLYPQGTMKRDPYWEPACYSRLQTPVAANKEDFRFISEQTAKTAPKIEAKPLYASKNDASVGVLRHRTEFPDLSKTTQYDSGLIQSTKLIGIVHSAEVTESLKSRFQLLSTDCRIITVPGLTSFYSRESGGKWYDIYYESTYDKIDATRAYKISIRKSKEGEQGNISESKGYISRSFLQQKLNEFAKTNDLLIRHENTVYVERHTTIFVGFLSIGAQLRDRDMDKLLQAYLGQLERETGLLVDILETR